jgi:hypothetical protein
MGGMLSDSPANLTPSALPTPDEDLLTALSADLAEFRAAESGADLVRVVCTNMRTGRELTAWIPVSVPSGDEWGRRSDEIQAACENGLREKAWALMLAYPGPDRGPALQAHCRAYAPERYLLALVLNHARTGRPGVVSSKQPKYQPYLVQLGQMLLLGQGNRAELAALKRRLCDEYTNREAGEAHAGNAKKRRDAREAFNRAADRYLKDLANKPADVVLLGRIMRTL